LFTDWKKTWPFRPGFFLHFSGETVLLDAELLDGEWKK